jgi:DNA-binding CsgD family transcriptional regulator/tetratricopeptide (TPR) repeat protein
MSSPTIIGRDAELEKLRAAWQVTVAGEPQLILVTGEAGIGKTRLAGEFANHVIRGGGRVVSGACVDLRQGGLPYAPIRQALRAVARAPEHRALLEMMGDGLAALLPDLGSEAVPPPSEQTRRVRLFESLLHLFQELASRTPVLLIVDDVQWADQGTLDLLTFLARNLTRVPVLELLTFRDERLAADDPLLGFLISQGSGTVRDRLTLGRLDERGVAAQIAGIVDGEPDPQLVEEVFDRSDGNPFFVEELLAARAMDRGRVPPTVRDLLLNRIAHLPPETRQVLRVAAVAGRTVLHETLSKVVDTDDLALSEALRAAIDGQVLELHAEEDGYTFRHTLLREALYDDLLPSERRRMHRTYAALLEAGPLREPSIMSAVATHHDLGGQPERALPAFIAAAGAAERSFAFADAERYLRRAVELWDLVDDAAGVAGMDRIALLSRATEAALAVNDTGHAVAFARAALELVDANESPARAGLVRSLVGRTLLLAGREQEAHDAHLEAIRTVPASPPSRERAEVLAYEANLLALTGRFVEARALGDEAIEVARRAHAVAEECRPLLTTGSVIARLGDRAEGLRRIDEAEAMARRHGLAVEIMRVYLHRGRALQAYAAWEDAWRNYARAAVEAPKIGMARRYLSRFQLLAARMLFWLGRWDDAAAVLREAREQRWGELATLPALLIATGQWDAAARWFAQPRSRWEQDGAGLLQQPEAQVELAIWLGDHDAALDHCAEGLALVARSEDPLPSARLCVAGLRAHADRAEAARAPHDLPAAATRLRDRLQALARAHPPRPDGFGRQLAALATTGLAEFSRLHGGDPDIWQRAAQQWTDLSMPYPATYARFRHAERLLDAPAGRADATRLLRDAYTMAGDLGAEPLRQAIAACASDGGLALHAGPVTARHDTSAEDGWGLTPREQQVLALLIDGYTNRRIGRALYIAESTASVHVSRILRKLGVRNRGEAIALVLRDSAS